LEDQHRIHHSVGVVMLDDMGDQCPDHLDRAGTPGAEPVDHQVPDRREQQRAYCGLILDRDNAMAPGPHRTSTPCTMCSAVE
jgi:hypothetical protein